MKLLISLSAFVALSFVVITKFDCQYESENESANLDAQEFYFCQRNWPDAPDAKAMNAAMMDVKSKLNSQPSRSTVNWTCEGPTNIGGRINCMAISKQHTQVMYAGMPQGGIFKTTDGGTNWNPVFDNANYLAIGSITIDPTNDSIVYAGTGDLNISGYPAIGDGIYKSTDAGNTWTHLGLTNE